MVDVRTIDGEIRLSGDLTAQTVTAVFELTPDFAAIHSIDLSDINHGDSAGLALLVHWYNQAAEVSRILRFNQVPAQLEQLAELGGLDSIFNQ